MLTALALSLLSISQPAVQPTPQPAAAPKPAAAAAQSRLIILPPTGVTRLITLDGQDRDGTWLLHRTIGYDRYSQPFIFRPAYPSGRADDVRRPGFNGTLWHGEVCIGGVNSWELNTGTPGARHYGASLESDQVATIRVGPYAVSVNPWETIRAVGKEVPRKMMIRSEHSRNAWLKQAGYFGGVRTFQNDAVTLGVMEKPQAIDLTPKAVFPSPTDVPHFKKRMEVKAPAVSAPLTTLAGATHVSFPPSAKVTAPKVLGATKIELAAKN